MNNVLSRLIGFLLIIAGVIGALGGLGEANPLAAYSDPLFNFSLSFLSEPASVIFWATLAITGLFFVGPKEGFTDAAFQLVRKK